MNSVDFRRQLHQFPELSMNEHDTAQRVIDYMTPLQPDQLIPSLGGTGVAVVFGSTDGKSVMLRCELDALPIIELNEFPHKSQCHGVSHKCGHDGHMAILAAVATHYSLNRPTCGRVILLFQPAEETGEGAKAVLADEAASNLTVDYAFALHNVPKFSMGEVIIKTGTMCCASRGATVRFEGETAHAAQPETGISPVQAIYQLLPQIEQLPQLINTQSPFTFATTVGVNVGEKAFGTAPSLGEVYLTLRSESDDEMTQLVDFIESRANQLADAHGLSVDISYEDVFSATVNNDSAVSIVQHALQEEPVTITNNPFRWSEDFGQFTKRYGGALFGLGAGLNTPDLHNGDYDFPDQLIDTGSRYFIKIVDTVLAQTQ